MRCGDGARLRAERLRIAVPSVGDGVGFPFGDCGLSSYEASETLIGFRAAVSAERVTKAAPVFVPCDGEFFSEADEWIFWRCSNLSTAACEIRSSFPPSRKAGRSPVAIRLRTCLSEHCHRRARSLGRCAWAALSAERVRRGAFMALPISSQFSDQNNNLFGSWSGRIGSARLPCPPRAALVVHDRIAISEAAFQAIASTCFGNVGYENGVNEKGSA